MGRNSFNNITEVMDYCEDLIVKGKIENYYVAENVTELRLLLNVLHENMLGQGHFKDTVIKSIVVDYKVMFIVSNSYIGFDYVAELMSDILQDKEEEKE